jgi:hypothetical protein
VVTTYQISLRTGGEAASTDRFAVCDSDREARELAQRMLEDGRDRGGRAEVWAGPRFIAAIMARRVLKWATAESPAVPQRLTRGSHEGRISIA